MLLRCSTGLGGLAGPCGGCGGPGPSSVRGKDLNALCVFIQEYRRMHAEILFVLGRGPEAMPQFLFTFAA